MNNKILLGVVGAVAVVLVVTLVYVLVDDDAPAAAPAAGANSLDTKVFDFICEVTVLQPIADIAGPRKSSTQYIVGGVDVPRGSGWYAGQYAMSETRKGTVSVKGTLIEVKRPALFQRYGGTVASEEYTLDRASGEFRQSLLFQDGQKVSLIKGQCGRFIRPPF